MFPTVHFPHKLLHQLRRNRADAAADKPELDRRALFGQVRLCLREDLGEEWTLDSCEALGASREQVRAGLRYFDQVHADLFAPGPYAAREPEPQIREDLREMWGVIDALGLWHHNRNLHRTAAEQLDDNLANGYLIPGGTIAPATRRQILEDRKFEDRKRCAVTGHIWQPVFAAPYRRGDFPIAKRCVRCRTRQREWFVSDFTRDP